MRGTQAGKLSRLRNGVRVRRFVSSKRIQTREGPRGREAVRNEEEGDETLTYALSLRSRQ